MGDFFERLVAQLAYRFLVVRQRIIERQFIGIQAQLATPASRFLNFFAMAISSSMTWAVSMERF